MAKMTLIIGGMLIALGLTAYFGFTPPNEEGKKSITALIPMFFGIPILLLGLVALKEDFRKHAMHGAVMLGLLGFFGALGRPIGKMTQGEFTFNAPATFQFLMALICLVFVVLCVKSFIAARRNQDTPSKS